MASEVAHAVTAHGRMHYLAAWKKLKVGIWPWDSGLRGRLPNHYKVRFIEKYQRISAPVNYKPDERKYFQDEFGEIKKVFNFPIDPRIPKMAQWGLWGGEGILEGLRMYKYNPENPRVPKLWRPKLTKRVLYSEILDRYMAIVVTRRTMEQIDAVHSFDHYILKTHENDLCSKLGMHLKREMLTALARKSFYPNNAQRQAEVYDRYKQYIIPEEEVEWMGLDLLEAEQLQARKEEEERQRTLTPTKLHYLARLVEDIKENRIAGLTGSEKSWLETLNPLKKKTPSDEQSR